MSDDLSNPYAPPLVVEPLATPETGKLWMVHGDHLLVRDGARLPPVPLFGEDDGGDLTTSQQVFAAASGSSLLALAVPLIIAMVVVFAVAKVVPVAAGLAGLVAFVVSGRLLRRFTKLTRLMANIQCYLPVATLKARARHDRWRSWMILTALACFLLFVFGPRFEHGFTMGDPERIYLWAVWFKMPLMVGVVGLFFGALVWSGMDGWLRCVRQTGGWFYLAGVPASSLAKLARMSAEPPPLRTRKVYSLYQYRLPLGILLGPRRNPLLILIVFLLKVFRSPAFVRQNFHWSERRRGVAPDESLAARIDEFRSHPELRSWLDLGCGRLDSPKGDLRRLTVRLASPDRRYFCLLSIYRLSKARAYVEVSQADFRTWTADGRCVLTCDQPALPRVPDRLDFQRVKGSLASQWARHLERCGQVTPVAIESDEEFSRLLERELENQAELLRATRIQGPVEEVEMPGDWEDVAKTS